MGGVDSLPLKMLHNVEGVEPPSHIRVPKALYPPFITPQTIS